MFSFFPNVSKAIPFPCQRLQSHSTSKLKSKNRKNHHSISLSRWSTTFFGLFLLQSSNPPIHPSTAPSPHSPHPVHTHSPLHSPIQCHKHRPNPIKSNQISN